MSFDDEPGMRLARVIRVEHRLAEATHLRAVAEALLAAAAGHRWRLIRNARLLREARGIGRTVDGLLADNTRDLAR